MRRVMTLAIWLSASALPAATETNLNVVDVMIAYDTSAVAWLASRGVTPDGFAVDKVEEMNHCLANSGLSGDFTFRLVGTCETAVDTSSKTLPEILNDLTRKTGAYSAVWSRRGDLGADLFSFITGGEIKSNQLGLGYTLQVPAQVAVASESAAMAVCTADWISQIGGGYGFNVCNVIAASDPETYGYTVTHEIAHNMGCGHTAELTPQMGAGTRFYTFSCGNVFAGASGDHFTVMGYSEAGLTPAPCFSSPDVVYDGGVTGSSTCDNVRTLRANYRYVAKFAVSKSDPGQHPEIDPEEEHDPEEDTGLTGEFRPAKAVNAAYPYVGAVYDAESNVVAIVQLKAGKVTKNGTSKVSATVIGFDGKKKTSKAVQVVCGRNAHVPTMTVKDWGALNVILGGDGFVGTLAGGYEVRSAAVGGAFAEDRALKFRVPGFELTPADTGYRFLSEISPDGEPIQGTVKWTFAKAAAIKYKKVVDDKAQKLFHYELLGCGANLDPAKPNVSALKLGYTAKTGMFKGSFAAYATNADTVSPGKSPKLKKYTVKVCGFVIDGVGYGEATSKKPVGVWPVTVE